MEKILQILESNWMCISIFIISFGLGFLFTRSKIFNETLKENGKFSIHRLGTFSAFWVAVVYAFIPALLPKFEVKEFVFIGFISGGGWSLYRAKKKNENTVE